MAKCTDCNREMTKAKGCRYRTIMTRDGKVYPKVRAFARARFGNEVRETPVCHDCGCQAGQFHHFGCDMERCPLCGQQALGCPCLTE